MLTLAFTAGFILALTTSRAWLLPAFAQGVPLHVVDLGYAKYQTDVSLEPGVTSFLGIRFASSPAGKYSISLLLYAVTTACRRYAMESSH